MDTLPRRDRLLLLAVLGAGVFLAGLELMITAVALPAIVIDLADWTRLREASWIINGYLLVYVVTMPLAGRLADLWGNRRLFLWALVLFTVGSLLAGLAPSLELLVAARLVQAAGGGILVPVATSAATHLFGGVSRPRALGVIGALTFLGMAAGPFLGAAILGSFHPEAALSRLGIPPTSPLTDVLVPAWRWVFYVNVPIGILAIAIAWAASSGWETPRRAGRVDLVGAAVFSLFLLGTLGSLTLLGSRQDPDGTGLDPAVVSAILVTAAVVGLVVTIVRGLRVRDPFLDPRLFRSASFSSATLVSGLTGYGFATAIVGGAVFVDRVLYGGPDEQRLALGALAGATAVGALLSGFAVRCCGSRLVTLIGLGGVDRRAGRDGRLDAGDDGRAGGARARGVRGGIRADRDATLHRCGRGRRPRPVRRRVVDGDRRADGGHGRWGSRSSRPTAPRRSTSSTTGCTRRPTPTSSSSRRRSRTGRSATDRSSRRSRPGPRERRPGSWSACSSSLRR
jgi:MFS family permease